MPRRIKSGQQRSAADRENFIFFLCPLDGVRFNGISGGFLCDAAEGRRVRGLLDDELAVPDGDGERRTGLDAALHDLLGQQRLDGVLHVAAQRTRAELRVIGRVDDELLGLRRQLAAQLLVGKTLVERGDLKVDDAGDVLLRWCRLWSSA